jgi:hypothetical protein
VSFSVSQKQNRQAFGAGGFVGFVKVRLAGPVRQQAVEVKEEREKPAHRPH